MDKLDELFELQREFDSYLEKNRNISGLSLDDWVQKGVIALIAELIEDTITLVVGLTTFQETLQ